MNNFSFYKDGKAVYCLFFMGIFLTFSSVQAKNSNRTGSSFFQQHQIQGTVTDGTNPLPGVTISIKNRVNVNTISDYSGQYAISASADDVLIVSFIGFKTAIIPVQGRTSINIKLEFDTTTLQEVRVNAGYYSVKESERTGNIARITAKDIETQPVTNVLATMQGRMAGVNIVQNTGVPGGGFDIKIRGQNSIGSDGNSPLYIIDGVPFGSDPIGSNYTGTTFPNVTSPLNSINPDSIESIEILKDADATSIYGSRGANGVVLITTKKGKSGKTKYIFTASTGAGKVTKFLKLMNTQQYLAMRKQAFLNDGIPYNDWDYDVNGTWDQNRYTDWQKKLLGGTAQITELQGSISGGSDNTQFLISGNYHTESTVFIGDFLYKKGGSQINLNHHSDDQKFKLNFSAGLNLQNNDQPSYDFTYDARSLPPNAPVLYQADGQLNWENGTWENPLRNINTKFESKTNDLVANTVVSYELIPGLTVKSNLGYTNLTNKETRIIPSTIYNPAYNVSAANSVIFLNNTDRSSWIVEPQINWKKEILNGKLDVILGSTFQNQKTTRFFQSGSGFSSNSLIYNLAAASITRVLLNDETEYKYQAFFGRLNYNWQQRYIINLTARRDGSSRFGPGNQFANFGAAGVAWLFSNEDFLHNSSWLSFGKIRSSYGTTGNDQIGDYQFLNTYTTTGVLYNGTVGLKPSRLFNPDFGWETNEKLEAAIELGFLRDRIFTTIAWYKNRSSNQLVGVPLPGTTGFTLLQSNLNATVENSGLELTLRTINLTKGSFNWTTNLNLTFAKNKLIEFPGLESSPYNQQYRIGQPLNIELLYKNNGVNPQTGVYEFEDVNKDMRISFPEDQQTIADLNPKYYGGIQNQLTYKNLTLDFLFQFVKQKNRSYPMGPAGMMSNQQERIINSWQNPGDTKPYQTYTTGYNNDALTGDYLYSESDASITDASFIRLKNISLNYNVPLHLKEIQCKIMLQGQNLLTFTKYKDGDPEFTSYGFLPPLKVITAGIQLTF
ncbi:SusC/RagA family TonB-linked outer membrane protein [Flavobacterium sp. Root420]|uniref:SusC/RagA family TonB-linked outer membrane protein n=1 Tax=Flavobacterium sp. Root420 TaxID=1736533 RepID=UPI0006FB8C28|nr:SusC/RagA family TonB-linked outer membrane protein [Flavobacterium sp. Root420]KQX00757.1 SusC/RagA family TonB-linked outer membrane protein [Flavobacterium sp. Root420]